MVKESCNLNQTNNNLSLQIIEHIYHMYNINSLKKSRFPRPSFKYYIVQLYTRGLNTLENCAMTNLH